MDPVTLAALLGFAQMGVELAQQYQSGALTDDQVNALLATAGIDVDAAVAAWEAAKAKP
jgi:hypothetical protein